MLSQIAHNRKFLFFIVYTNQWAFGRETQFMIPEMRLRILFYRELHMTRFVRKRRHQNSRADSFLYVVHLLLYINIVRSMYFQTICIHGKIDALQCSLTECGAHALYPPNSMLTLYIRECTTLRRVSFANTWRRRLGAATLLTHCFTFFTHRLYALLFGGKGWGCYYCLHAYIYS